MDIAIGIIVFLIVLEILIRFGVLTGVVDLFCDLVGLYIIGERLKRISKNINMPV